MFPQYLMNRKHLMMKTPRLNHNRVDFQNMLNIIGTINVIII